MPALKECMAALSPKQRDVIEKRYGLRNGKYRTLEDVGDDYGITRERVRQIEKSAFDHLLDKKQEKLEPFFNILRDHIHTHGGVRCEEKLMEEDSRDFFKAPKELHPSIPFCFLTVGPLFSRFVQDNHFHTLWAVSSDAYSEAKKMILNLIKEFENSKRLLPEEEFYYLFKKVAEVNDFPFNPEGHIIDSYFDISKLIEKNIYGEYGLVYWPEVRPRGAGEKAYIILKKFGKPMHFRDLAKKINESGFGEKTNHFQTVHNELIKDTKFILIGRGIYALEEWGYKPGTISDLLVDILKKSGPMTKDKIMKEIKNQRLVKESTILMNLQNKKLFKRNPNGYIVV